MDQELASKKIEPSGTTWVDILRFISCFIEEKGYSPTFKEIAIGISHIQGKVGLTSSSLVAYHVSNLQKRNILCKKTNSPRTISISEKGRRILDGYSKLD